MRVEKHELFHISRELNWKTGDCIVSGIKENPFWKQCTDYSPTINFRGKQMPLLDMVHQHPEYTQEESTILTAYLESVSQETALYIREQVFEDIRRKHFPNCPSRQTCLWVTELPYLSYWLTMSEKIERRLLRLELIGDLFRGDEKWLTLNTFSAVEYANRALHYWSGELTNSPNIECLFCGNAYVKEIQIIPVKNNVT